MERYYRRSGYNRVQGARCRVQGARCGVQGEGCGVQSTIIFVEKLMVQGESGAEHAIL